MTEIVLAEAYEIERPARKDENPAIVYLASLSNGSRRTMRQALDTVADMLREGATLETVNWHHLRYEQTAALASLLTERYSAATAKKTICAVRGVLKSAWRMKLIDGESYQRAIDVQVRGGATLPAGRAVERGERNAVFLSCAEESNRVLAYRDACLLAVLFGCGIRRAELTALNLDDYDAEDGSLRILHGKGNKQRMVYAGESVKKAIDNWLALRGTEPGPLLLPLRKGGRIVWERMTEQGVFKIVKTRAMKAGVKSFSPHDFRRTFVSELLEAGADISVVSQLAGHASVETTRRYDRRGEKAKKKAVDLLHVPYQDGEGRL